MIKIVCFQRFNIPAFLFDERQSRQETRMILIILLDVNILYTRFIIK